MKYMLLIYGDEQALSETERQECYVESTQLAHDLHSSGQYVAANPLHPTAMATSVQVRKGKRLVTTVRSRRRANNWAATFLSTRRISTRHLLSPHGFRWRARGRWRCARSLSFPDFRHSRIQNALMTQVDVDFVVAERLKMWGKKA